MRAKINDVYRIKMIKNDKNDDYKVTLVLQ